MADSLFSGGGGTCTGDSLVVPFAFAVTATAVRSCSCVRLYVCASVCADMFQAAFSSIVPSLQAAGRVHDTSPAVLELSSQCVAHIVAVTGGASGVAGSG